MKKKNIVLILTDQHHHRALSYLGNEDVKTPNLDKLAKKGYCFTNAYCTYPLCSPSRASIFTGVMPHEAGVEGNNDSIHNHLINEEIAFQLKKEGYKCVYGGKWHVPECDIPNDVHGFERIYPFCDHGLAENCVEFIKNNDEPFFLVASFDNPHNICEWAREQNLPWGNVESPPVEECPNLPSNFAIPPYEPEAIRYSMNQNHRVYAKEGTPWGWWRKYIEAYYQLVAKVDHEIGKILDAIEQEGLMEDTVIIMTADHGEGLGAHQWKQKTLLYEEAVKVPLIIWDNSQADQKLKKELITIGLDLHPTICDYAGIPLSNQRDGRSIKKVLTGDTHEHNFVVAETVLEDGTKGRMIRWDQYKYIVYEWGRYREQLFNLEDDSGEMTNLAYNKKYSNILKQGREQLMQWGIDTEDRFGSNIYKPDAPQLPEHAFPPHI